MARVDEPSEVSGDKIAGSDQDEEYISIELRRTALAALRHTASPALITALIFATVYYLLIAPERESSVSWYGPNSQSFIRLYLPSAFILPLIQTPFILRRTLKMRLAGKLQPPLDARLAELPWRQWSVILGLVAGGVWAALVMSGFSILSSWTPDAQFGVWAGFSFKLAFTAVVGLSVAVVSAFAAVRITPESDLIHQVLSSDDEDVMAVKPASARPSSAADLPATDGVARPGRVEVPARAPQQVDWNRWRAGVRPEVLQRTEEAVFFSRARRYAFIRRGMILITMSVLLASFGLYSNSAQVVVAAMFISPLMTPILGLTVALVTGHPTRQIESALIVIGASGYAIVITSIAGFLMPDPTVLPSVLIDYTDPRLADLMIALLAGVVGAYILVHTEASTALPGVVVSLSLEPPLAAAGLTLAWGFDEFAAGAFLMFILNLAAIVAAGSVVLILSGFLPVNALGRLPRRVKIGLVMAGLAVVLVAFPLYRASVVVWHQTSDLEAVGTIVIPWATEEDFEVMDIQIEDEVVTIDLSGGQTLPSVEQLTADVASALDRPVEVRVRVFPYILYQESAGP